VAEPSWQILQGDCIERLRKLPDESVQCCVTSPPYFGLRDYDLPPTDWQAVRYRLPGGEFEVPAMTCCLGFEETPEQFIGHLVQIFREVARLLRDDGTVWVNLGDSYNSGAVARREPGRGTFGKHDWMGGSTVRAVAPDLKPKDLLMVPALVALALRADDWYLRRDIIWNKPNPMPESVTDRPTSSHEYLFLLSKSPRYFYDAEAIRETAIWPGQNRTDRGPRDSEVPGAPPHRGLRQDKQRGHGRRHDGFNDRWDAMSKEEQQALGRNKRSVWTIATRPYPEAHFATFPPDLVEPCIAAGSRKGDTILDPFAGAGTTNLVATRLGRDSIGIELNPDYAEMAEDRIRRWEANPAGHLKGDPEPLEGQLFISIEEAAA